MVCGHEGGGPHGTERDYGPITDKVTDQPTLARIPSGLVFGWYADIDPDFVHTDFHEVCIDVDLLGTGLTCEGICHDYVAGPPPTPTPHLPTNTPTTPTPTNTATNTPTETPTALPTATEIQ